jgi:hypothetical protein
MILAYRSNDFIDDHFILHHNNAYFSSINYFLENPPPTESSLQSVKRKTSFSSSLS